MYVLTFIHTYVKQNKQSTIYTVYCIHYSTVYSTCTTENTALIPIAVENIVIVPLPKKTIFEIVFIFLSTSDIFSAYFWKVL